jgi:hypothetical protein
MYLRLFVSVRWSDWYVHPDIVQGAGVWVSKERRERKEEKRIDPKEKKIVRRKRFGESSLAL